LKIENFARRESEVRMVVGEHSQQLWRRIREGLWSAGKRECWYE